MLMNNAKCALQTPSISDYKTLLVDIDQHSVVRSDAEQFVVDCFSKEYSATVDYFLNQHILSYDHGELNSVVGYQPAANHRLYLEQYLPVSIEQAVSQRCASDLPVNRSSLVEVGNLASTSPGSFRRLILSLCRYFSELGYAWVVFTSTPQLLNTFSKLGVELLYLSDAQQDDLKGGGDQWGSYYQHKPKVMAGNIAETIQRLNENPVLSKLLDRAPMPQKVEW